MSASAAKGRLGENGVVGFLNLWLPEDAEWLPQDRVFPQLERSRSRGAHDVGDVSLTIPHVAIEVKNQKAAGAKLSGLLDNAEWKGQNAGRAIWFLAYKRDGYSAARAGYWHTCVTLNRFVSGFAPHLGDPDPEAGITEVQGVPVEELCDSGTDIDLMPSAVLRGCTPPSHRWSIRLMFRPHVTAVQRRVIADMDEGGDWDQLRVPFVVTPRRGRHTGWWYVHGFLEGQARILETLGALPQDPGEYVATVAAGGDG